MSLVNPSSPGAFYELNFFKSAIISPFVEALLSAMSGGS
jgi:hypothetical protein